MKKKNINKTVYPLAIIVLILFLVALAIFMKKNSIEPNEIRFDNGKLIKVEIARTELEKKTGLMNRTSLLENQSMLFVYDNERLLNFWMKNTLIPLDIIFLDKNKIIVNIADAKPCEQDPCELYSSQLPAMYVIEVNSGFAKENNIKIGDRAEF